MYWLCLSSVILRRWPFVVPIPSPCGWGAVHDRGRWSMTHLLHPPQLLLVTSAVNLVSCWTPVNYARDSNYTTFSVRILQLQWSLTYSDYSLIRIIHLSGHMFGNQSPFLNRIWLTYMYQEIQLSRQSVWERRCPDKWDSTVVSYWTPVNYAQNANYTILIKC